MFFIVKQPFLQRQRDRTELLLEEKQHELDTTRKIIDQLRKQPSSETQAPSDPRSSRETLGWLIVTILL